VGNFFDALEKHMVGVLVAMSVLIGAFIYLQMKSFEKLIVIEAFHQGAHVDIPPEEIMLQPENIMLPANFKPEDVKNIVRDANDPRERSNENYSENNSTKSASDVEKEITDLEAQMRADAGGAEDRARIMAEIEKRKDRLKDDKNKPNTGTDQGNGADNVFAGSVMVDFSVPMHTAHQNNNWYVRNPGYTCPKGSSGRVTVIVKVNQAGSVLAATYDPSRSSGANSCMIEQARKYAKKSRFNFADDAADSESGWITYTFISE
jgi:hypothetical protein